MEKQNYARLNEEGMAVETWLPPDWKPDMLPSEVFTSNLVFVPCPAEVSQLWHYDTDTDTWTEPAVAAAMAGDAGNGNPPPPPG